MTTPDPILRLSRREREVLSLLGEGLTVQEVATRIYRSRYTVYSHVRSIRVKVGLHSIPSLALYALKAGLVEANSQ